ncbi:hypothetical protein [Arthrobacter sp. V1I9]|uniref:hypothetical protein n=1 Tax=Arthrobacter sp. V1I9 TaxID=3042275 RepID=UPI0027D8A226|nr:hypothetical protein [Arthrobacter sp. V1I9]
MEAQKLRRVDLLTLQRKAIAEQLAAWHDLDAGHDEKGEQTTKDLSPDRLSDLIGSSLAAFQEVDGELEKSKSEIKAEDSDPKLAKKRQVARRTVLLALVAPVIIDLAILVVSLPVALRVSGEWALPTALSVIFPATSGSGWAALVITFFVPHIAATSILGWWAFRVRELDSEKFAKATETARSLLGGYIALLALIACVYYIHVFGVGWFDNFAVSLKELTKPLLPILSVAAFVATFGPGYSKYTEGLAELEKKSILSQTPLSDVDEVAAS